MAVIRPALPQDRYTLISNDWLRDARLSFRAKGVLAYILSHSAGHRLTTDQMVADCTEGRDAIRTALVELETVGYLTRHKIRGPGGKITSTDFIVVDPSDASAGAGNPGASADQPEQDVSAAQTSAWESGAGESAGKKTTTEKTTEDQHTQGSSKRRATRLPEDFQPNEAMREWYRAEGIGRHVDGRVEHEKFMNHFLSKPGAAGTKLDWPRTWMNWMREAAQRAQGGGRYAGGGSRVPAQRRPEYRTAEEKRQEQNRREAAKSKIFDQLVEQEGLDVSKPLVVQEVSERAEAILNQLVNAGKLSTVETCRDDRYTGPDGEIIDAVWYESPKGVTTAA